MERPDEELSAEAERPRSYLVVMAVLLLVAAGGALDLALDAPKNWRSAHVLFEVGLLVLSLSFALYLWRGWSRTSRTLEETRQRLLARNAAMETERDEWRRSAQASLEGLGRAIERQFDIWGLTPTEREIALLLLKGYGHKQAAALTGRSERTVRQHAVAVYQKAGLSGRAELAAFFLEDLLLPRESSPSAGPTGAPR
ncbi:MAG TPA: helix-turn-helix transcriptional regulator [Gemmatimonadaceae bacterium]|nr:helix-turn-helix transcriptional regulator [Gemmatimonadaceae bacterium]